MNSNKKVPKITFCIPEKEWVNLKMICMLTHTTMTNFIRSALITKIKELKEKENNNVH